MTWSTIQTMRKAPKTIPRNPATSILRRVTTKLNRLPIPINSKRKSPAKKKSVKGEFTRIAVDVPLLCPLGSIRNNIPPVIAPIARITWMMQRIQFRFAFIFIGQNGYWVLGIRYWVLGLGFWVLVIRLFAGAGFVASVATSFATSFAASFATASISVAASVAVTVATFMLMF